MSKPAEVLKWATDVNFPAGADAWSSQPNKVEPSAAKVATGRIPEEPPPAEETNWWRSMVAAFIAHLVSLRLLNLSDYGQDVSAVAAAGATACACYDGEKFVLGTSGGETVESEPGGWVWEDTGGGGASGPNVGVGNIVTSIASDLALTMVCCCDTGVGDEVYHTVGGVWTPCTITGAPGLAWIKVECYGTTWLISDDAATPSVYRSTNAATFSSVTVTGLTTQYPMICASKDPDNDCWVILTATQCARSSDGGLTWTTAAHGLNISGGSDGTVMGANVITYDRATSRFIVILGGASAGDVAYSEDNGATWTTVSSCVGWTGTGHVAIVASGDGEILAHLGNSGYWASQDGGETWLRVYVSTEPSWIAGAWPSALAFGGGKFLIHASQPPSTTGALLSLRAEVA